MDASTEVAKLFASFEDCKFDHQGTEAWRARDLQALLGYTEWRNFREAITRAWDSCAQSGNDVSVNFLSSAGDASWVPGEVFVGVNKNPKGGRPSEDVILTRRAAFLVAMNGDPRKPAIAFAQQYFATATRTLQVLTQRLAETNRLQARGELSETENRFQGILYEHDVDGPGIGRIRSMGDEVLFGGNDTKAMKKKWKIKGKRPLADFAPEVLIRAKQLGAAMTAHNVKAHNLRGEAAIADEHVDNNQTIRVTLTSRGIVPEKLAHEEDIKKIERRHASEAKKLTAPVKVKNIQASKSLNVKAPKVPKAKKPTVKSMVEWFSTNHERAVECSPHDSEEGGYLWPTAEVSEVLEEQFPSASPDLIEAAMLELDDDGPWITQEFTQALEEDRRSDSV